MKHDILRAGVRFYACVIAERGKSDASSSSSGFDARSYQTEDESSLSLRPPRRRREGGGRKAAKHRDLRCAASGLGRRLSRAEPLDKKRACEREREREKCGT